MVATNLDINIAIRAASSVDTSRSSTGSTNLERRQVARMSGLYRIIDATFTQVVSHRQMKRYHQLQQHRTSLSS